LRKAAESNRAFDLSLVGMGVEDGVATITIRRPDAMNALNEAVVAQLAVRLEEAYADPRVRGVVLAGVGKAFVAGADIRFFVRAIEEKRLDRIRAFTERGHALLARISDGPKPVVARVHGLALGGGLELALACDAIVASPRAMLSFPETGIGIYPGLGGTARTARRVGVALARWLVLAGPMCDARTAAAMGLVDEVVPHADLRERLAARIRGGKAAPARSGAAPALSEAAGMDAALRETEGWFARADVDAILEGRAEPPGAIARSVEGIRKKAPLAVRLADRFIREGAGRPLAEALALELGSLEEIFSTRDALEGLSSLGRRAPVFEGR
jgi:enoyl-CoA hydratase/3-hydroxyacyl-CoA dehydrogenase